MKKRMTAALCLMALLLGSVCLPPRARAASGTFSVGYGKRDITPDAAVPMAGYGDTFSRMSKADSAGRTVRMDDNGDGVVDEKDGQFATCIAIRDGQGNTLLWFGYDMINANDKLVAKMQARVAARWDIPAQNVLLNASHTHSGADLTQYFNYVTVSSAADPLKEGYDADVNTAAYGSLSAERKTAVENLRVFVYEKLLPGLMGAAEDALADLAPAEMSAGSIHAPGLNFIRHYYGSASTFDPADVYGDNTRSAPDYKKAYAAANDVMYLLRFDRSGRDPVVAADWRAHPKLNSTGSSTYGKAYRPYLSSDYVNAFRFALEEQGYKVVFLEGTAGNVNTFSDLYLRSKSNYLANSANPTDKDTVQTYQGKACQIGSLYGRKLATYALQALTERMAPARSGVVQAQRVYQYADYDDHENYKMIGGTGPDGNTLEGMLFQTVTDAKGVSRTAFDYLQTYYAYTTTPTAENQQVAALLDQYGINSVYHLNRINSKFTSTMTSDGAGGYVPKSSARGGFYLYAYEIGPDVACVTAPFEIFDGPYSFRGATHATTFVLGYSNGSKSYMPTRDTFFFAQGRGAYEANNTTFVPGTAEAIADTHARMLAEMSGVSVPTVSLPDVCPHCGAAADWKPLAPNSAMPGGHYFLGSDMTGAIPQMGVYAGDTLCLHLNGHGLISNGTNTSRLFATFADKETGKPGGVLSIMGDGVLQSQGAKVTLDPATGEPKSSPYQNSGVIHTNPGTTLNLYGGTVRYQPAAGQWSRYGGAIGAFGTVNMYGGTVTMAAPGAGVDVLTEKGGLVYVGEKGAFCMTGGLLTGGRTAPGGQGDNLTAASGGTIELGGDARIEGGVWFPAGAVTRLSGTVRVARGETYALYVSEDAEEIDASAIDPAAQVWIAPTSEGRRFAAVSRDEQAAAFRCDGEGRVVCDGEGRLYVTALPETEPGDLNGDGKVNGKDVVFLQRALAGGYAVSIEASAADLNGDGKVNGKDAVLLQRFIAGGYGVIL